MKILNLEIRNIRGIRHFRRDFNGGNAIILGANGTGKSSVFDAIDFLLTGNISRLHGKGTREISLKKHGVHVDKTRQLEECWVKATVKLKGHAEPVTLQRCVNDPENLNLCESARADLETITRLALQGQHMLQRRQMLNFVAVTPNDRASQIQSLLDIDAVECTRKTVQSVTNVLRKRQKDVVNSLRNSESYVATQLNLDSFEDDAVFNAINAKRNDVGLQRITRISSEKIKEGIRQSLQSEVTEPSPALLLEQFAKIEVTLSFSNLDSFAQLEQLLREKINTVQSDRLLLRSLNQLELIRRGIQLIETDSCPLCDRKWDQNALRSHLESKIDRADQAASLLDEIESVAKAMNDRIYILLSRIPTDLPALAYFSEHQVEILNSWRRKLEKLSKKLLDSHNLYPSIDMPVDQVASLFANEPLKMTLVEIQEMLTQRANEDKTEDTRHDSAVEKLSLVADRWPELLENRVRFQQAESAFDRSAKLLSSYIDSRDAVLSEIYDEVSCEFTCLYRRLHGADESAFAAQIEPQGAGLRWEVDFYGRGTHPPNALHSEGHQDSMGLCLFLVLSEWLSGEYLNFMLLDDVVTSVDAGHRRELARLLADELPDRQVILTTHDHDWYKMLVSEDFAKPPNLIRLKRWDIDIGIVHSDIRPDWELIDNHLDHLQFVEAAAVLRNWAERFFKQVCHNFRAPVPYDIDGRYTLDDVLRPGLKRFKDSVSKATKMACRNGNSMLLANLELLEEKRADAQNTIDKEVWLVNRMVHDNEGIQPTADEIRNVVNAFQEFYRLLHCDDCSRMLSRASHDKVIGCKCGKNLWKI